ncbi:hypothetical protein [Streptomyces sp. NPDC054834]
MGAGPGHGREVHVPECKRRYYFCLPLRTQGCCDPCARGYEPSPDTYFASTAPVTHRLAA